MRNGRSDAEVAARPDVAAGPLIPAGRRELPRLRGVGVPEESVVNGQDRRAESPAVKPRRAFGGREKAGVVNLARAPVFPEKPLPGHLVIRPVEPIGLRCGGRPRGVDVHGAVPSDRYSHCDLGVALQESARAEEREREREKEGGMERIPTTAQ